MGVIEADRQRAQPTSYGMIDCVRNGRGDAARGNLAEVFGPNWIELKIGFINEVNEKCNRG